MDALNNARRTPPRRQRPQGVVRGSSSREHEAYVVEHLEDMPEVRDWVLGDWAEKG